ncbi:acyl-CoA carboxylase subunit epsilon [Streptomyces sp. YIM 98790]|uniref:acyl-CoA carboxylase subunit epsilon n=1 Tax=Streptomyces sp. YIM 98790 TaxID=2689077 RepID=UPI00140E35DA|nr:acyl-CoA carboxylase subunit epsilon [Streptomyces sp. YIM 98790]
MVRVVRGNPTPEELAAAMAVVQARMAAVAAASGEEPPRALPVWSDPARTVPGRPPAPGPDAWRTSFWPA